MKKHKTTIGSILAAFLIVGTSSAGMTVDRTIPIAKGVEVVIEVPVGKVVINAWDRDEIRIQGTLGDDIDGLEIEGDEDELLIAVEHGSYHDHRGGSADLTLEMPASVDVSVEGVKTDIRIVGLRGDVSIETVRGDVFLDRVEEHLQQRGAKVARYSKPTFAKPAPVDLRHEIAVNCDAVIEALAD